MTTDKMQPLTKEQRDVIGKKFEWYVNNQSILNSLKFANWLNENTEKEENIGYCYKCLDIHDLRVECQNPHTVEDKLVFEPNLNRPCDCPQCNPQENQ